MNLRGGKKLTMTLQFRMATWDASEVFVSIKLRSFLSTENGSFSHYPISQSRCVLTFNSTQVNLFCFCTSLLWDSQTPS